MKKATGDPPWSLASKRGRCAGREPRAVKAPDLYTYRDVQTCAPCSARLRGSGRLLVHLLLVLDLDRRRRRRRPVRGVRRRLRDLDLWVHRAACW